MMTRMRYDESLQKFPKIDGGRTKCITQFVLLFYEFVHYLKTCVVVYTSIRQKQIHLQFLSTHKV